MNRILVLIFIFAICTHAVTAQENEKPQPPFSAEELAKQKDLHYRELFFFALANEESRQKQIELTPHQVAKIQDLNKSFWTEFGKVGEERGRILSKMRSGQVDKASYQRLREKNIQAENQVKESFNAAVAKVLLPHQLDRIAFYAKRSRLIRTRDEFEVPILIAKERGMPKSKIEKINRQIQSVRKEFYAKLNEERDRRSKIVLNSMDKDVRQIFEKKYSELYDFRAEEAAELIGEPIK